MADQATKDAADDLIDALQPLDAHVRAMFGEFCFYVNGKVTGLICGGHVFVKRSTEDDLLAEVADLAPAYPGARDTWRLPPALLRDDPDRVRDLVSAVAAALPQQKRR